MTGASRFILAAVVISGAAYAAAGPPSRPDAVRRGDPGAALAAVFASDVPTRTLLPTENRTLP